jgi:hypothetical protein
MDESRRGTVFIAVLVLGLLFSIPAPSQRHTPAFRANDTELLMLGTAGGPPLRKARSEPATLLKLLHWPRHEQDHGSVKQHNDGQSRPVTDTSP